MFMIRGCLKLREQLWDIHQTTPLEEILDGYQSYFERKDNETLEEMIERRNKNYGDVTSKFYTLASPFFELIWGPSFHFCPKKKGESHMFSMKKLEYQYAAKLQLKRGDKVVDLGCGIGGPARHMADFSGAHITGITITPSQVSTAIKITKRQSLDSLCKFVEGDMCKTPFADNSFHKAYSIEATAYTPCANTVFSEIYRILKPGGLFLVHGDAVLTEKFDDKLSRTGPVYEELCKITGSVVFRNFKETLDSLRNVGFEIIDHEDLAKSSEIPLSDDAFNRFYEYILPAIAFLFIMPMEFLSVVPKGTCRVYMYLKNIIFAQAKYSQLGLISPLFVVLAKKPEKYTNNLK